MERGSLHGFLRSDQGASLSQLRIYEILVGLAEGLDYIQGERMIHRDVRAANMLLNNRLEAKVGDFGLARNDEYEASQVILGPKKLDFLFNF